MLDKPEVRDPERDFAPPEQKEIAVAVTMTAQISQNRSIVMQTYIPRDAEVDWYHHMLDKLSKAVDRQEAKASLEAEEANLALEEKTLKQQREDFVAIEERAQTAWEHSRKKGPWPGLTAAEAAQKGTAATNIRRFEEAITKRKAEIAKLKALIDTE